MTVVIREAHPADVPAVAELFRARDERFYDEQAVSAYVAGFDPARCLGWIAFDGPRPVGMSMVYLRKVRMGAEYGVGYWGNLFVHRDYRKKMVYPKLPLAMFRGAQKAGLDFVVTCTRHPESAATHVQLGCRSIGRIEVLAKPLRPAALIRQRKGWQGRFQLTTRAVDTLFGAASRAYTAADELQGGVEELSWSSPDVAELVDQRNAQSAAHVHTSWTADEYRHRFASTLEGDRYVLMGLRVRGRLTAGVVWRMAERSGIRLGVIIDVIWAEGAAHAMRRAIVASERCIHKAGGEVVLYLDGLRGVRSVATRLGYFRSPEVYDMLIWPSTFAPERAEVLDAQRWWFSFADHDAL